MSEVKITRENFEEEVLKSELPVLVDFWAVWCGPCQMLAPSIEQLADEYDGKVKVGKLNIDEEMDIARQFHVSCIPTVILFKDGKAADKVVGAVPIEALRELIGKNV